MPTVTELLLQVRGNLDEAVAAQWSNSALKRWINEGNRDIARATKHFKDKLAVSTIASQSEYTLAANVLSVEHAWYDDGSRYMPMTPRQMEGMDQVWGADQNSRTGYPAFFTTWGFAPAITLKVFPAPVLSSKNIRLLISRLPAEITINDNPVDASVVETVSNWYDALVDYCEYRALRKDRDPRWQEAYQFYETKRDGLINNPDYITANREVVADPMAGYLPAWLTSGDGYY